MQQNQFDAENCDTLRRQTRMKINSTAIILMGFITRIFLAQSNLSENF